MDNKIYQVVGKVSSNNVRVTWTTYIDIPEHYWDELDPEEHDMAPKITYEGIIIGSHRSILTTYVLVACTDGKIRDVPIESVTIIEG